MTTAKRRKEKLRRLRKIKRMEGSIEKRFQIVGIAERWESNTHRDDMF
jgi:hypothetical protein